MIRSDIAEQHSIENIPNGRQVRNLIQMAWFLQELKGDLIKHFGVNVKLYVGSGFRSLKLNSHPKMRGSQTSYHMDGLAADITCSHFTPFELAQYISTRVDYAGYDKLINEYGRWVHVNLPRPNLRCVNITATKVIGETHYLPEILNVAK